MLVKGVPEGSGLTHWGQVTHICVGKLIIIGSDNGLSPERRQANMWTNARILLIGTLGTTFSEILSKIHTFSFKKIHLKMSSGKCRPFCLGLNELNWAVPNHNTAQDSIIQSCYHGIETLYALLAFLWGETASHRWIPSQGTCKSSFGDATTLTWCHCNVCALFWDVLCISILTSLNVVGAYKF